jgi:hypothetical protein
VGTRLVAALLDGPQVGQPANGPAHVGAPAMAGDPIDRSAVDDMFASLAGSVRVDPFTQQVHAARGSEASPTDLWQDNWVTSLPAEL